MKSIVNYSHGFFVTFVRHSLSQNSKEDNILELNKESVQTDSNLTSEVFELVNISLQVYSFIAFSGR